MARYQVATVERPEGWEPASWDDVPPAPGERRQVLADGEDLFAAVRRAIEHNERSEREGGRDWAVVVEPGSLGQTWPGARLCTPLAYKVTAIGWPTGWEPQSPADVPRCVWKAQAGAEHLRLSWARAVAVVRGLNQQSMSHHGSRWYVVAAVENEPVSQTVSYDSAGTETTVLVRRLHLVMPEEGGRGDCSWCPAHRLDCARSDAAELEPTVATVQSRPLHVAPD
jgi:hypothetical protein